MEKRRGGCESGRKRTRIVAVMVNGDGDKMDVTDEAAPGSNGKPVM